MNGSQLHPAAAARGDRDDVGPVDPHPRGAADDAVIVRVSLVRVAISDRCPDHDDRGKAQDCGSISEPRVHAASVARGLRLSN